VILIDTRYFKDFGVFTFIGKEMLGEKQWEWLEDELKDNEAEVTLLVSG